MRNWADTIVLVTGGGSGIGRACALAMARRGATVFICGRRPEPLEEVAALAENLDGVVRSIPCDVTVEADVAELGRRIADEVGRLDVVVNNAGVLGPRTRLEDVSLEDFEQVWKVNVTGAFLVSREATPLLRRSTGGIVLNVSSSVGRTGRGLWGPYAISKHGLEGMTDVLADELADDGVCVVSVNPGGTATPMRREAYPEEDPSTIPSPETVAETFVLLAERLTVETTGRKYSSRALMRYLDGDPVPNAQDIVFDA